LPLTSPPDLGRQRERNPSGQSARPGAAQADHPGNPLAVHREHHRAIGLVLTRPAPDNEQSSSASATTGNPASAVTTNTQDVGAAHHVELCFQLRDREPNGVELR
jgi:hypothetical protein